MRDWRILWTMPDSVFPAFLSELDISQLVTYYTREFVPEYSWSCGVPDSSLQGLLIMRSSRPKFLRGNEGKTYAELMAEQAAQPDLVAVHDIAVSFYDMLNSVLAKARSTALPVVLVDTG